MVVDLHELPSGELNVTIDGRRVEVDVVPVGGQLSVRVDGKVVDLTTEGTPPEMGYPTAPAGPLPKGTYNLKVVTPLIGVFEGSDREVSTAMTKVVVQ